MTYNIEGNTVCVGPLRAHWLQCSRITRLPAELSNQDKFLSVLPGNNVAILALSKVAEW